MQHPPTILLIEQQTAHDYVRSRTAFKAIFSPFLASPPFSLKRQSIRPRQAPAPASISPGDSSALMDN